MILILIIFTYSHSDSKIRLIMPENNTNNLNENLIKPNINCHSQFDDQIHYYKHECFN
jgi:DNA-binding transcriptional regulator/RsmH inhibitor MraZ